MKRTFFFVLLLFCTQLSSAQSELCTWVVIDTVVEMRGSNSSVLSAFKAECRYGKSSFEEFVDVEEKYFNTSFKDGLRRYGVQFKLCSIQADTLDIGLHIDNRNGIIWLEGIPNNGDTLHIPVWSIRKNCFRDSIFTRTDYFEKVDGKPHFIRSERSNVLDHKRKCTSEVGGHYNFTVNGNKFDVNLMTKDQELITHGNGSWGRKKRIPKDREREKYFDLLKITDQKFYYGEVVFSERSQSY